MPQPSPLGYSVGRWENDSLIVTTTAIDWIYFDEIGTPQSPALETEEIFTLSDKIAVIYEGEIMGIIMPDELDIQLIGLMMKSLAPTPRPRSIYFSSS